MSDYISIHAPCEGGDQTRKCPFPAPKVFQSTPPARGATSLHPHFPLTRSISIHAPREGGDIRYRVGGTVRIISIHAPRKGGDGGRRRGQHPELISIHAPREGGDQT